MTNGIEYFLNAAPGFTATPSLNETDTISWTNGGNLSASGYGTDFVVQTSGDLILLQVFDHVLLLAVQPARRSQDEEL